MLDQTWLNSLLQNCCHVGVLQIRPPILNIFSRVAVAQSVAPKQLGEQVGGAEGMGREEAGGAVGGGDNRKRVRTAPVPGRNFHKKK
jgi:hypothetical protein